MEPEEFNRRCAELIELHVFEHAGNLFKYDGQNIDFTKSFDPYHDANDMNKVKQKMMFNGLEFAYRVFASEVVLWIYRDDDELAEHTANRIQVVDRECIEQVLEAL